MESDADAAAKHFQAAMMEVVNQHVRSVEDAIRSEADQGVKFDADRISALRAQVAELTLNRKDLATWLDATVSEHRQKVNELHSKAEQAASRWSKEEEEMVSQLKSRKSSKNRPSARPCGRKTSACQHCKSLARRSIGPSRPQAAS